MNPFKNDFEVETFTLPPVCIPRVAYNTFIFSNRCINDELSTFYEEDGTVIFYNCTFYTRKFRSLYHMNKIIFTKCRFPKTDSFKCLFAKAEISEVIFDSCDLHNIKSMKQMFYANRCLKYVQLSNNDTSNLVSIALMFKSTVLSSTEGLSTFNVSNVKNMNRSFSCCSKLRSLHGLEHWDVSNVEDMSSMFSFCIMDSLHGLEHWDVSNVKNMEEMFHYCESLKSLHSLQHWNVSNVEDMSRMFHNCKSLKSLHGLEHWDASNVKKYNSFFHYESMDTLFGSAHWNVLNDEIMKRMFQGYNHWRAFLERYHRNYWFRNMQKYYLNAGI